jgi:hypothetical protein
MIVMEAKTNLFGRKFYPLYKAMTIKSNISYPFKEYTISIGSKLCAFLDPVLIETNCYIGSKHYLLVSKLYYLLEAMLIQMNICCIFSMVEIKDYKVTTSNCCWKQSGVQEKQSTLGMKQR